MPTNIIGLMMWNRHINEQHVDKTMTRKLTIPQMIAMLAAMGLATVGIHYILVNIGGAVAWLDAMTVSIGIVATLYEMARFSDQYILWLITDVIAVITWVALGDPIMITKKAIYLIMAVVGLIRWRRMAKTYNEENL